MGAKSKNERNGAPFGNKLKIYFVEKATCNGDILCRKLRCTQPLDPTEFIYSPESNDWI